MTLNGKMRTTLVLAASLVIGSALPADAAASTRLVSKAPDGSGGNHISAHAAVSADGRFVAFESGATNLSTEGNPGVGDIFVWDRQTGAFDLVTENSDGVAADSHSFAPSISADGRYVAFESWANNLSTQDDDSVTNVFLRDRVAGTTTLVSRIPPGKNPSPSIAADCHSEHPSISADGRYVAFASCADNLSTIDLNSAYDVFVFDRDSNGVVLASQNSDQEAADGGSGSGTLAPKLSSNGRYVVFGSYADNLSSIDGAQFDVFRRDLTAGTTELVSRNSKGVAANGASEAPAISATGRYVAFRSTADNLSSADNDAYQNVFVRDMSTGKTRLASRTSGEQAANGDSYATGISGNGRYVLFTSGANNLSSSDNNTYDNGFVRDMTDGKTRLISRSSSGKAANGHTLRPAISANGKYVAFDSYARNLSSVDHDDYGDVFLRGPLF